MNRTPIIISAAVLLAITSPLLTACGEKGDNTMGKITSAEKETEKIEESAPSADAYDSGGLNLLCGIDSYGRVFKPISGWDDGKDVGLFYFLWHGESGKNTFDITKMLESGDETFWDVSINTSEFHYWGEPLYGYYNSWDRWVVSRHVEMFIAAGIDYLIFDVTNGPTYEKAYTAVCEILSQYQQDGWNVPKIVFYTNSRSVAVMKSLYDNFYYPGKYKNLWYCPDGEKPMIIGDTSEGTWTEDDSFLDFFDLRRSQWPNAAYREDGIPWMDWNYPQKNHSGFMNVSVAQHPQLPFSNSILNRDLNQGRGYDFESDTNVEADSRKGTNFQSQWDTVIENKNSVNNVFVTGWNEWIAQKLNIEGNVWFVDCATEEFSRDIEPMKGGYEDFFYLQLCDNIRAYKGKTDETAKADSKTIDINGDISQWDDVKNEYTAISQNRISRLGTSVDGSIEYKQSSARNNIQSIKVTNDEENLYFLITSKDDLVKTDLPDFMNLYLGAGELELVGWQGYEYILCSGDKALYSFDSEGAKTKISDAEVSVNGRHVQIKLPIDAIGAKNEGGVYFKLCDGFSSTDIMDSYTEGKCLPMGRLSYYYYFG